MTTTKISVDTKTAEKVLASVTSLASETMPTVSIKLDDPRCAPKRAHPTDAGADLVATHDVTVDPLKTELVDTGVAVKIPKGYVGLVFSRSSQGKVGVNLANGTGVIDSDYRGNIKVLIRNNDHYRQYQVKAFDTRVAQLVIVPIMLAQFVESKDNWLDTARGEGGFGSTGT